MALDPYAQLGVARDATNTEITKAWRAKIRAAHPDRNPNDPHAATRAALINEAYDILRDHQRRLAYDAGDTENPHALLSAAREMIRTKFRACMNAQPKTGRIIHDVGTELGDEKRALLKAKGDAGRANASLNAMRKRFRRRTDLGVDILNEELDAMIAHNDKQLVELEKSLKCVTLAIKLLADFEDVTDASQRIVMVSGLLGSSTTTSSW